MLFFIFSSSFAIPVFGSHHSHVCCWSLIKNKKTIQRLNFANTFDLFSFFRISIAPCVGWTHCVGASLFGWSMPGFRCVTSFVFVILCFLPHSWMNRFSAIQSSICQSLAKWNPNLRQIRINIKLKHFNSLTNWANSSSCTVRHSNIDRCGPWAKVESLEEK